MDGDGGGGKTLIVIALGCGVALGLAVLGIVGGAVVWTLLAEEEPSAPIALAPPPPPPARTAPPLAPYPAPPPFPPPPAYPLSPPTQPPSLPPPPVPPPPQAPRMVRATVTASSGASVAVGASCGFAVDRRDRSDGTYWCNAQIVCGGQLIYGGPEAGYFPCTLHDLSEPGEAPRRDVVGSDPQTTSGDRDAALTLDTRTSTLEVWDDEAGTSGAFRITARIDSIE